MILKRWVVHPYKRIYILKNNIVILKNNNIFYYIMIRTLEDIMYISDGNNPYRKDLLYGRGGLGYKPTPYNIIGNGMNDSSDEDDYNDDMLESYLIDSIEELNKNFDALTKEEFEQMKSYQTQLEDIIENKNKIDEHDEFILNEIKHSKGLINNILNNFDNREKYIYNYDVNRGFISNPNDDNESESESEEESIEEDDKDFVKDKMILSNILKMTKLNKGQKMAKERIMNKYKNNPHFFKMVDMVMKGGMIGKGWDIEETKNEEGEINIKPIDFKVLDPIELITLDINELLNIQTI